MICFELPEASCLKVLEAVKHQCNYLRENGLPEYGFPCSLLLSVPEISNAATKVDANIAKSKGFQEYSYPLYHKHPLNKIYGEINLIKR